MTQPALSLHPTNPHYFLFRGKPTVLVTSAEHYGAVMNLEFDYRKYLDTLAAEGLNHTRNFVGVYRELPDEWWPNNSLGPQPGQFVCPFGRSNVPGARDGGNKFDLETWDETFFQRLTDFCALASDRGVVIEITLFCVHYVLTGGPAHWELSPWHPDNNINDVGPMPPAEVFTLKHPSLVKYQDAMVRRIVRDLNRFDNLYYETINEPYWEEVPLEWEHHIADLIVAEERNLPLKHLISRNVANGSKKVEEPVGAFSIFNFHYPRPKPDCIPTNYHLNKVIGCNETGFDGPADEPYRIQAWQFMLAGGALFNNLDPSFGIGDEAGSVLPPGTEKHGGGPALRSQIRIVKDFVESFDFVRMAPDTSVVTDPGGANAIYVLAEKGRQYGTYILKEKDKTCRQIALRVPAGSYTVQFVDVLTGPAGKPGTVAAHDSTLTLDLPEFPRDLAIRITREPSS